MALIIDSSGDWPMGPWRPPVIFKEINQYFQNARFVMATGSSLCMTSSVMDYFPTHPLLELGHTEDATTVFRPKSHLPGERVEVFKSMVDAQGPPDSFYIFLDGVGSQVGAREFVQGYAKQNGIPGISLITPRDGELHIQVTHVELSEVSTFLTAPTSWPVPVKPFVPITVSLLK